MTTTNPLSERIANLSPEQRELLLRQLRQKTNQVYRPTRTAEEAAPTATVDLDQEAELDPSIQPTSVPGQFNTQPKAIFLTGGTGFLGAFLVAELLVQTRAVIYCLVRANNREDGLRRLRRNLESYDIWRSEYTSRLVPVLGDLASPQFGLSDAAFQQLAYDIDTIYHCAASLNFVFPYTALKPMNVTATEDILRLASTVKRKTVHHMSSVSVFESEAYAARPVDETDMLEHHEGMFLGYAQSKWVAEKLVLKARSRGLPVCIYRLPFISGHSETGAWNTTDFTCLTIKGCMEMGTAPILDYTIDMCPVDYASRAITYLAHRPESAGQVFHLMNPYAVDSLRANEWNRLLGSPVKYLPYKEWQAQLDAEATSPDHPLFSLRSFFLEPFTEQKLTIPELYTRDRTPQFQTAATLKALEGSGIQCHAINPDLYATYFDYFLRKEMLDEQDYSRQTIAKFKTQFFVRRSLKPLWTLLSRPVTTVRQGFNVTAWRRINLANP